MAMNRPTASPDSNATLNAANAAIRQAQHHAPRHPLMVGICGAQGSGKSTLAAGLAQRLNTARLPTAVLSLDDLYLTRAERQALARDVHPLFRTRGVPGTHDIALGLNVVRNLENGHATHLPSFDKANDDRAPEAEWRIAPADTRILIFEGWCVGAKPEAGSALAIPVNTLEREEDSNAIWRSHVNKALAGDYQQLFARIDLLILLAAPDFSVVRTWRIEQENDLRRAAEANPLTEANAIMSDAEISRFIQHFERLTRHILQEMPARADLVIELDENRRPTAIRQRQRQS